MAKLVRESLNENMSEGAIIKAAIASYLDTYLIDGKIDLNAYKHYDYKQHIERIKKYLLSSNNIEIGLNFKRQRNFLSLLDEVLDKPKYKPFKKYLGEDFEEYDVITESNIYDEDDEDSLRQWIDDEDLGDELADYEWDVGKYISDNLPEPEEDDDFGDELGDALYDAMPKIARCMKKGISPEECGQQLMDDEDFMANFNVDED